MQTFFYVKKADFPIFVKKGYKNRSVCLISKWILFIMGRGLTETQNDSIAAMLRTSMSQQDIAAAAKCSIRSVKRVKKNLAVWDATKAPKLKKQGRPRMATESDVEVTLIIPICRVLLIAN